MGRQLAQAATRKLSIVIAAVASLATTFAHADCVDGVRQASAAENEFAARATAALFAGLPASPANTQRPGNPPDFDAPQRMDFCRGQAAGAFSPGVFAPYTYSFPAADAQARSNQRRELLQQIEQLEKLPPDKEAQQTALNDQSRAAYDAAPKRKRSDPPFTPEQKALADKAYAEGRRLEDLARKVEFDHRASVKPQTEPLTLRARALEGNQQEFRVALAMNDRPADPQQVVATFGTPNANKSAGLKVHSIQVLVTGPEGEARQALIAAIDRKYLQSLIGAPLPEISASKGRGASLMAPGPVTPATATVASAPSRTSAAELAPAGAPAPANTPARNDRPQDKQAGPTLQDAANAVNKLKGLFGR